MVSMWGAKSKVLNAKIQFERKQKALEGKDYKVDEETGEVIDSWDKLQEAVEKMPLEKLKEFKLFKELLEY